MEVLLFIEIEKIKKKIKSRNYDENMFFDIKRKKQEFVTLYLAFLRVK